MQHERLAVIGDPIDHSLSPAMQNAALRAAGLPMQYEALCVPPHELGTAVSRLRRHCLGFNVTIPHKREIQSHVDTVHESAAAVGAVNTVVRREGRLIGYNTDPGGFAKALAALPFDARGCRAVIFGSGGAARSVVAVLARSGCRIGLVARNQAAARALAATWRVDALLAFGEPGVEAAVERADLLVNATPMGMLHLPDASPLPDSGALDSRTVVLDLVYGRDTPLLSRARERGCRVSDGLEMLVQQGAESFVLWTGIEPDVEVMREACRSRLKELAAC